MEEHFLLVDIGHQLFKTISYFIPRVDLGLGGKLLLVQQCNRDQ
jgi:hypothetical protein